MMPSVISVFNALADLSVLEIAQLIALLAAGLYFGIKAFQGRFVINLSLELEVSKCAVLPTSSNPTPDDLVAVIAKVIKGPTGSVTMHGATVKARWGPGKIETKTQRLCDGCRRG